MKPEEMLAFGRGGGIGTCISLISIEPGSDLLPCKAGDVITVLKPIKENLYLGFLSDQIGHFRLDDVNLIYLNLSVASPRKNKEKYQSFTALLEKNVPIGFYGENNIPEAKASVNNSVILEETEAEMSMEEMPNATETKRRAFSIAPNTSPEKLREAILSQDISMLDSSYLNQSSILPKSTSTRIYTESMIIPRDINTNNIIEEKVQPKDNYTTEDMHNNGINIINEKMSNMDLKPSQNGQNLQIPELQVSDADLEANNNKDHENTNGEKNNNNANNEKNINDNNSEKNINNNNTDKNSYKSNVNNYNNNNNPSQIDYRSNRSETKHKGLFHSIKSIKKKADNLFLSARLDPSLMLLPTSGSPMDPLNDKNYVAKSENMRKFYSQANEKGDSIVLDQFGFIQSVSDDEGDDGRSIISTISGASNVSSKSDRLFKYELTKESKWRAILTKWTPSKSRKSYRVKKLVEKGIPDSLRGRVWSFLSNVQQFKKAGTYQEMLGREKIPIYDVIERDIRRTYPRHSLFYYENSQGLKDLYSILKAYAQYNPEVGYCQGMGMLVGLFLMQGLSEEDAFWLLVSTNSQYLQGYFTPTLSQLRIHSAVFEYLLEESDPKLAKHLSDNDITSLLYVTPWFLTVYTMTLPWASVLQVWDLFYYKGVKILFRFGLAIMKCVRNHIFRECPTAAELLPFLLHVPHEFLGPEKLMDAYKDIKLTTAHIQSLCR
ncbi:TBC-domain-containing protein, partial [Neoconidiobolus thromboides FSU 785]